MNTEHLLTKQNGIQTPFIMGNFGLAKQCDGTVASAVMVDPDRL